MANGSGVSRGDRNRNARLARLRELVPTRNAIVGIDLADKKQMVVEDLTHDKTDEKDAVLIARLTAQLRCYEPEPVDETWARLRHLGARREQLMTEIGSQLQQMRDLWLRPARLASGPCRCRGDGIRVRRTSTGYHRSGGGDARE